MTSRLEELKNDVAELSRLMTLTSRSRVKDILSIEVRKLETEIIRLNEAEKDKPQGSTRVTPSVQRCYDVKLTNYAWDQSDKYVKLFVTLKNVNTLAAEQVSCVFTKRTVDLAVRGLDNKNYFLTINNLLRDIDEEKSHWKVKTDMVVVWMVKSDSTHWKHLTASESKLSEAQKKETEELGKSDDPSGDLMSLMKKMYLEGDDEMKRTIAKAWVEGRDKRDTADLQL